MSGTIRALEKAVTWLILESPALVQYLETRKIPLELAREHCKQVEFELYEKRITVLGFLNRSGGYELRNANFKGSNSPKDVGFIDNGKEQIAVFEGFFSYLSFLKINGQDTPPTNFLVLNSLAFLERSREMMERHGDIHLFLDRDPAGKRATEKALQWAEKYRDRSDFYSQHKDLEDGKGQRFQGYAESVLVCHPKSGLLREDIHAKAQGRGKPVRKGITRAPYIRIPFL